MRRGPIRKWQPRPPFHPGSCDPGSYPVLAPVSRSYPGLAGRLPTCYSPVRRWVLKGKPLKTPPDLHVLGTPPAFVLSQDQTLLKKFDRAQKNHGSFFRSSVFKERFLPRFHRSLAATVYILSHRPAEVNNFFLERGVEFFFLPAPHRGATMPSILGFCPKVNPEINGNLLN